MFQMSDRARRKLAERASRVLPGGTVVREAVAGRAQPRFTPPVIVVLVLYAVAMAVALALGVVLIPGGILLLLLVQAIIPQRVVVIADQGVAVLARSSLTGRPSKVVAQLPLSVLHGSQPVGGGKGRLALGPDQITFPRREHERLLAATRTSAVAR